MHFERHFEVIHDDRRQGNLGGLFLGRVTGVQSMSMAAWRHVPRAPIWAFSFRQWPNENERHSK
jgi:hypothetical protein